MPESALPFPTKTRLAFAVDIAARQVRWYNFVEPDAYNTVTGRKCIAALVELVTADPPLAHVPQCDEGSSSIAELTPEGMAWVTRARTSKISTEGEGPGSTSPEPGPPADGAKRGAITHEEFLSELDRMVAGPGLTPVELPLVSGEPHDPGSYCEVCRGYRDDPHDCPAGHSTEDGAER